MMGVERFWIEMIEKLRRPGQSDACLAAQIGVSKQFMSDVLARKKELGMRVKLLIWSMLNRQLDRDAALGFLPGKVAEDLQNGGQVGARRDENVRGVLSRDKYADWATDLIEIMDTRGATAAEFAADLGVSGAYLSALVNRRIQPSWAIKVVLWQRKGYDLSRDTVLSFLPVGVVEELINLDVRRGYRD
jgi:hypothetical protein